MIELTEITPLIGLNVFIIAGMARYVPMGTIFRGIVPFLLCMNVLLALVIAFRQIALFAQNNDKAGISWRIGVSIGVTTQANQILDKRNS